jgi:hypothetical protein
MISVIGEEFVSYCEAVKGQYSPLVTMTKYDQGTLVHRDMTRDDLLRIPDEKVSPGGWLFRKTQNSSSAWIKRFCIVRGEFMLLFHSPQNEKPIGIIPLGDCKIVLPDGNEKSFDEQIGAFRANDGFEFDIRHTSRSTARFHATSNDERGDWCKLIKEHIALAQLKLSSSHPSTISPQAPSSGNITITSTRLIGLSLAENTVSSAFTTKANVYENYEKDNVYPYSPPKLSGNMIAADNNMYAANKSNSNRQQSLSIAQQPPYSHSQDRPSPFENSNLAAVPGSAMTREGHGGRRKSMVVVKNEARIDFAMLEKVMHNRMVEQKEARSRESIIRQK